MHGLCRWRRLNETRDAFAEEGRNELMRMRSQKEEPLWETKKDKPSESDATHEIWLRELTVGKRWSTAVWQRGSTRDEWDGGPSLDSFKSLSEPAIFSRKTGGNE